MNCFYHPTDVSTAICQDCGRGLCHHCSKAYETPICIACNRERIKSDKTYLMKDFAIIFGLGGLFFLFFGGIIFSSSAKFNLFLLLYSYYLFCSIVAGWRFLTKISPNFFLVLPLVGWLIFFLIKGMISVFVGPFILPYRVYQNIKRWKELNEIEQNMPS